MRASKFTVFLYASMVAIPLLLIAKVSLPIFGLQSLAPLVITLLAIFFILYGVVGFAEVALHKGKPDLWFPRTVKEKIGNIRLPRRRRNEREITFYVKRFNNAGRHFDKVPYKLNVDRYTTVLDALLGIKSEYDNTLSMRYSCRMGICGSCGMEINGRPCLACETNVFEVEKNGAVEIGPMLAHPLLKDLVTSFDDFFEKHKSVEPTLFRNDQKEQSRARKVYKQTDMQLNSFLPYSYCIMCGLCMDSCPVVNTNQEFIGPQALSQVYRYHADSRDQKGNERLTVIDRLSGAWGCEYAGACSDVCPEGVDPASAIQLLKADIMKGYIIKEDEREEGQ